MYSLFRHGTVCIDAYHEKTPDKAVWRGHYYSDKAPGTAVLCIPAFAAGIFMAKAFNIDPDSEPGWLLTSWMACAFSISILTALGGVACCLWLAKKVRWTAALVSTLALFLGAAPYPYATMMYSHAFVVALIALALWAIDLETDASKLGFIWSFWPEMLVGYSLGFALASEFTAGLVIVGVGMYGISRKGWKRALVGIVASIPPLLIIPLYNYSCFGSPLQLGYAHQATFD